MHPGGQLRQGPTHHFATAGGALAPGSVAGRAHLAVSVALALVGHALAAAAVGAALAVRAAFLQKARYMKLVDWQTQNLPDAAT